MSLLIPVLISNVTNLGDARYAAGMGVQLLGFRIAEQGPTDSELHLLKALTGWVAGVETVAEWQGRPDVEKVENLQKHLPFNWLQADFQFAASAGKAAFASGMKLMLRVTPAELPRLSELRVMPQALLISLNTNESPDKFIFGYEAENGKPILLLNLRPSDSANPENLAGIISNSPFDGIALSGGTELKPGLNNFLEIAPVLEALEED